ncbi:Aspartate carbamoyltransferase [bacterium HR41]|nr:Aspartate carbamoyltransferase [bacterium HR41]
MGCEVTVCGPPTLVPRAIAELGCSVRYDLAGIERADVIYALRVQRERIAGIVAPSLREYVERWQIDGRRLRPGQVVMHPGPVNRGVELASEVCDSPQSLIVDQVEAGVAVRMAVLYELLAGAGGDGARLSAGREQEAPQPA